MYKRRKRTSTDVGNDRWSGGSANSALALNNQPRSQCWRRWKQEESDGCGANLEVSISARSFGASTVDTVRQDCNSQRIRSNEQAWAEGRATNGRETNRERGSEVEYTGAVGIELPNQDPQNQSIEKKKQIAARKRSRKHPVLVRMRADERKRDSTQECNA